MENPSGTNSRLRIGVGVGVGVASNGSGNGNRQENTLKKNVNGHTNQLTTHKDDQVIYKDINLEEHSNFNKPISFKFLFTLPESLFRSKKEVEPKKIQEVETDEDDEDDDEEDEDYEQYEEQSSDEEEESDEEESDEEEEESDEEEWYFAYGYGYTDRGRLDMV